MKSEKVSELEQFLKEVATEVETAAEKIFKKHQAMFEQKLMDCLDPDDELIMGMGVCSVDCDYFDLDMDEYDTLTHFEGVAGRALFYPNSYIDFGGFTEFDPTKYKKELK